MQRCDGVLAALLAGGVGAVHPVDEPLSTLVGVEGVVVHALHHPHVVGLP